MIVVVLAHPLVDSQEMSGMVGMPHDGLSSSSVDHSVALVNLPPGGISKDDASSSLVDLDNDS